MSKEQVTCPRCTFVFEPGAAAAPSVYDLQIANANDVMEKQRAEIDADRAAIAELTAKLDGMTAEVADLQAKLVESTPKALGPFATMEEAIAGGVPAEVFAGHNEIVHTTDVDVVGEAGTVVEVKHDAQPVRMVGPTFDLP